MKKFFAVAILVMLSSCNSSDDTTIAMEDPEVVAEFKSNLSELNLFTGNLSELNISSKAFEYNLNSQLFTDYAHKQRLIALPNNTSMQYNGDGLPIFPENTVIAKTFYYNMDERDLSLGRTIIETRVLIKINGNWVSGDYKWNTEQTDAILYFNGSTVPITWIDSNGISNSIAYKIPSDTDCYTCHSTFDDATPIGPKLRNLNFNRNGINQIDHLINNQYLTGVANSTEMSNVVNWQDTSASLASRARSYMDINCAYCHLPGGFCDEQSTLNLDYNTMLEDSQIIQRRNSITNRISAFNEGFSMPFIGTTILHTEGIALIQEYLDSL